MLEWMGKYREAPRRPTSLMIDRAVIIFLGLTLSDFASGVICALLVTLFWDSALSLLIAVPLGVSVALVAREYRRRFPERTLEHWGWAIGLARIHGVPRLFAKRRYRVFGP